MYFTQSPPEFICFKNSSPLPPWKLNSGPLTISSNHYIRNRAGIFPFHADSEEPFGNIIIDLFDIDIYKHIYSSVKSTVGLLYLNIIIIITNSNKHTIVIYFQRNGYGLVCPWRRKNLENIDLRAIINHKNNSQA